MKTNSVKCLLENRRVAVTSEGNWVKGIQDLYYSFQLLHANLPLSKNKKSLIIKKITREKRYFVQKNKGKNDNRIPFGSNTSPKIVEQYL